MVKVVIIGAGVAGLVAGKTLVEKGFDDVTILEAQNRVGGRVWTVDSGEHVLELGAQWVHGTEGNSLYDIASSHELIQPSATDFCKSDSFMNDVTHFHLQNGTRVEPKVIQEVEEVVGQIRDAGDSYYRKRKVERPTDDSMHTFWWQQYEQYLESCSDTEEVKKVKRALHDWYERYEGGENACTGLHELSLYLWGQYAGHGQLDWEWKHSYRSLIGLLLAPVADKVLLNAEVKTILLNESADGGMASKSQQLQQHPLTLKCSNGTDVHADHVIVTLPLGVLKRTAGALFHPALPLEKVEAIETLGFGTTDKIFLIFDEPFWSEDFRRINLVWLEDDMESMRSDLRLHGLASDEESPHPWWRAVEGFQTVRKQPNVLCGWISGSAAEEMESQTDETVLKVSWILLKRFNGCKVPEPSSVVRSRWSSAPHSRGSYTSIPPYASGDEMERLAKPICSSQVPRILFAGEATDVNYFSTVGGAYSSGLREAHRLLDLYSDGAG